MAAPRAVSTLAAPAPARCTPPVGDLVAVIPAFNEGGRIAAVVRAVCALGLPVLVIDDGSRDHTGAEAAEAGAQVVRQVNGGKGHAMLTGCAWAVERGFAAVLLLDGDGQHDPAEAAGLIRCWRRGAALVIGKRVLGLGRQPLHRRCFNRLSSLLVSAAAGHRIIDSQSGFRVCDPRLLLRLPLAGRRYDLETEMCVLVGRARLRVVETPISVIYNDKRSGLHPLWDTLRFLRAVARSIVGAPRARRRLRRNAPLLVPHADPPSPVATAVTRDGLSGDLATA